MANIKLSENQINNGQELFRLTDKLRTYLSDSIFCSEYPATGEDVKLYFEDTDSIRMELYRNNGWILERIYKRNGNISEFKPVKQW